VRFDYYSQDFGVVYELGEPSPSRMKPGIYTGRLIYSLGGAGNDFDFGDRVTVGDSSLTLNIKIEVKHAFAVEFPAGSDRAVLEPPGGWRDWLGGRAAPQRLFRDIPFRLWSTGPFKAYKLCQYPVGDGCGIRNDAGHEVPVTVSMSMPGGMEYSDAPIQKLPLPTGSAAALQIHSATPVFRRPSQLHFEVGAADVKSMVGHPGTHYQGEATIVFDALL